MKENLLYLALSVALSSGRNIVSKKTAILAGNKSQFFLSQSVLFGTAVLLISLFGINGLTSVSSTTVLYGVIYGILLVLSQWMYTIALKSGNTSVCSVIYSLGFILPTMSGALFWNEDFTALNLIGIFIAIAVILLTARKNGNEKQGRKSFIPFIIIAMLSSGGLGIMQKVHQSADVADEKAVFLFIAFILAFGCSFIAFLFCREKSTFGISGLFSSVAVGVCFGGANLCNTILAGRMKSAVFFPLQNVSTILLTTLLGIAIFKEKLTPKTVTVIILGIAVVLLFSV